MFWVSYMHVLFCFGWLVWGGGGDCCRFFVCLCVWLGFLVVVVCLFVFVLFWVGGGGCLFVVVVVFFFLHLHLFRAIEHVSRGKALEKYAHYFYYYYLRLFKL